MGAIELMNIENVEVAITLPRTLWEELSQQAKMEQSQEARLLIRAIEQFLGHKSTLPETKHKASGDLAKQRQQKKSSMGKYAHIPGNTEAFMAMKQHDIDSEG